MTENEMRKMQQEAVKRAEEMQNRARGIPHRQPEPPPRSEDFGGPPVEVKEEGYESKKPPERHSEKPNETGGLFETLMKDKERTLILALILLLMDEQTDNSLILALLYLLI